MSFKASRSPSPPSSEMLSRRSSYAYRAVKKVEDVARRMSTPHFTIDEIEQRLEDEIRRESVKPNSTIEILRRAGDRLLHSKKVLLLIVLLNVIDCVLVMSELILDIHYIKEMVQIARELMIDFGSLLRDMFSQFFFDVKAEEIHLIFNRILCITYDVTQHTNLTSSFAINLNASNDNSKSDVDLVNHFTVDEVPSFLSVKNVGKSVEEYVAHALHKTSISILGVLVLIVLLRCFCYGARFFKKKLVLFDGFVVITSFILDIVFIKGLMGYTIEDAVEILAILIPWRVVRVANSLVMAVVDQAHLKLKMEYKQKRKIQGKLEHSMNQCKYYKNVLSAVRELCQKSEIPAVKLIDCIASVDPPPRKKKTGFRVLKKRLYFKCLRKGEGRPSLPYAYGDADEFNDLKELDADPNDSQKQIFRSTLTSSSSGHSADINTHKKVGATLSSHSVHFEIASDDENESDDVSDIDILDELFEDVDRKDENMNA